MGYSSEKMQERKRNLLDPRTKIVILLMVAVFVLGGAGGKRLNTIRIALSILPYILLGVSGKWKELLRGIFILGGGYALLCAASYISGPVNYLVLISGMLMTKFAPGLAMGNYLLSTVTVSEFVAAMDRMYMPQAITIPMAVMFRFFPTVMEEMKEIGLAMKMKGLRIGGCKVSRIMEYRLVPTITCSVKIGEELSAAALTRGLDGVRKRTNICCIGFRAIDMILLSACLCVIIYSLIGLI